jgi:ATP-binding cassette subfamily B (MDR/TAP) protein 1
MAFEGVFKAQFDSYLDDALTTGIRGAFVEGCTYGVASGLIYLAEALLFFVGAILIARGFYTYLQMVEVLNLVVFSVTIGSQLMAFSMCFFFINSYVIHRTKTYLFRS